jgi:DNA-nicking Smr family endonuclease
MIRDSKLDLHGVKHQEVENTLNHFFFWEKPGFKNYTIITGNSQKMRKIVLNWLDNHEYCYYIPSHNLGEIKISE